MRYGLKIHFCLLLALATRVGAVVNDGAASKSSDGTYSSIWLRNVFDLKPVPIAPPRDLTPTAPPPNIKLQGITTILGGKRAIFSVQENGIPGKPAGKEESYMLKEGERQGMLEVIEINPKGRNVKIKVDEMISTITFETNKPAGGGAPVNMAGGGIPRPQGFPAPPAYNPGGYAPGLPQINNGGALPFRPIRTTDSSQVTPQNGNGFGGGYVGGYAQTVSSIAQGASTQTAGGTSIPTSLFNQAPGQLQQSPPPQPSFATAEEQVAMLLVQQKQNERAVVAGTFPSLPPLPGVPSLGNSGSGSAAGGGDSGPPMPPSLPTFDDSSGPPMPTLPTGARKTGTLNH